MSFTFACDHVKVDAVVIIELQKIRFWYILKGIFL